ncbi:TPR_REGION domain-containing protein [Nephila pilipes]|uniref:TPR_REGION domain-containing protein n=1 Tax=Nephila pilipes TaxID=299642 RepID=A0A8X6TLZ0_NEPPI|nr:TPR_REGION domain-containing protein [Nephila pilipes]
MRKLSERIFKLREEKMTLQDNLNNVQEMIDWKKYDDAEKLCSDLITDLQIEESVRKSGLAEIFNIWGLIMYKKVEFNKAQSLYKKSIEMNPSLAAAYYNHGVINYRLGLFDSALKDFQKAVQLDPDNLEFSAGLQASKIALDGLH